MDQFIDNLSRELAKPTSRRGVMRLIGGAVLGGLVAAWKPSSLQAQTCSPACKKNEKCCTTGASPFCANVNETCCGNSSCNGNKACCNTSGTPFCAPNSSVTCCGSTTCTKNQTCCDNLTCCDAKQTCISGVCQASKGKK